MLFSNLFGLTVRSAAPVSQLLAKPFVLPVQL